MGIFDKAKGMLGDEKKTDALLDKAENLAKDKLGADKADQVSKARDAIDDRVGDGNPDNDRQGEHQPVQHPEDERPGDNQR